MLAKVLMSLFLVCFSAVFALPATLSDRLTALEQKVKLRELDQNVKALSDVSGDEVNEEFRESHFGCDAACERKEKERKEKEKKEEKEAGCYHCGK